MPYHSIIVPIAIIRIFIAYFVTFYENHINYIPERCYDEELTKEDWFVAFGTVWHIGTETNSEVTKTITLLKSLINNLMIKFHPYITVAILSSQLRNQPSNELILSQSILKIEHSNRLAVL